MSSYDLTSGQSTLILDHLQNSDAVVVTSDGRIYLGSWYTSLPGNSGGVSVVSTCNGEVQVVNVGVAVQDMYIDQADNIFVIGPDNVGFNLYLLPAGNYKAPVALESNLGNSWSITESGCNLYYAVGTGGGSLQRITGDGTATLWGPSATNGLSASGTYLYFAHIFEGTIGRVDLATGTRSTTLVSGLHSPTNVRYSPTTGALYFLEAGTDAQHFTDGTLRVVYPPP